MFTTLMRRWLRAWAAPAMISLLAACGGGNGGNQAVAPTITAQPAAATATEGEVATFTVVASGTAPLAYQWQLNGAPIAGATTASYTTPALAVTDDGAQYSVVVSNSAGSVTSSAALLTAQAALPPMIVAQPSAVSVVAPATATFSVSAQGPSLAYQWTKNGSPIAGATAASYTTPATALADSGALFAVIVSNLRGQVASSNALLSVSDAPLIGTRITAVHASGNAVYVLDDSGVLHAKGNGSGCRIGDGGTADREVPVSLGGGWAHISGGHTLLALKTDGTLWAWGNNQAGSIGDGSLTMRCVPILVGSDFRQVHSADGVVDFAPSVGVKRDGTLWLWGKNIVAVNVGDPQVLLTPTRFGDATDWTMAVAGPNHVLALKSDGSLWSFGDNQYGQLGNGSTQIVVPILVPHKVGDGFAAISAGYNTSFAVKANGELYAWGWNQNGVLGDNTNTDRSAPVLIGSGFRSVDATRDLAVALKQDGTAWAWGVNAEFHAVVGDGTTVPRTVPTQVASGYVVISSSGGSTVALDASGRLWGWGLYDWYRDAPSGNFVPISARVPTLFDYFPS